MCAIPYPNPENNPKSVQMTCTVRCQSCGKLFCHLKLIAYQSDHITPTRQALSAFV